MKNFRLLVLMLPFVFLITSCTEEHCGPSDCGNQTTLSKSITSATRFQRSVVDGKARYVWDVVAPLACTATTAKAILDMDVDTSKMQIPIEVQVIILNGGEIDTHIISLSTIDNPAFYFKSVDVDVAGDQNPCAGGYQARLLIEFDTTGQSSFDHDYIDDVILIGTLEIRYNEFII